MMDLKNDGIENKMNDTPDFRWTWLKKFLLQYFNEEDGRAFTWMLRRHNNKSREIIRHFLDYPLTNIHDWQDLTVYFYNTQYEKTYYKWVYITKKVWRPVVPVSQPASPDLHEKRDKVKSGKGRKEKKEGEEHEERQRQSRPHSPQTVMEAGPLAESEQIFQKVKTLVRKKKWVNVFHCRTGPFLHKVILNKSNSIIFLCRKSVKPIPLFHTYSETRAEFPKYVSIGTLNNFNYEQSFKKHVKLLGSYSNSILSEPELSSDEFPQNLVYQCRNHCYIKDLILPYDTFFKTSLQFYESYQRISRKLFKDCGNINESSSNYIKQLCDEEKIPQSYTLKTILCSPLHTMDEELANTFYNIRIMDVIKEIDVMRQAEQPNISPLKTNLINHLLGIVKKLNWCLNHIESDIDIEITPWPGIDELLNTSFEELKLKTDIIDKMAKKLEIWGRYIKNLLNKCRSKDPKGSGPVAEYQYWFKREDHIGPLLLTLFGKNVSDILNILKHFNSSEVTTFIQRCNSLKKYYEISRDNRDYISVSIQCLEGINNAKDMDEVQSIIPEFWKNLRYLWLLSGYWAVKNNIVGFVERVQYLIVKKCIKVLEVNHFFLIPQRIAKQLAVDVINTMEKWKSLFYEEKNRIETNQWEMRWEFPTHRIFTVTDYIAKLAKDFCYLSDSLKQYLDIFCPSFSKVVKDENVIEGFCQRVKSLTVPLRTADFNIYDPDNDVHWNLLIETFTRELTLIESESLQIINQSFKNLKSAVFATDLLLTFKDAKSHCKPLTLLLKKFEYVNMQIIKEIKLIKEFIVNRLSAAPILSCHSSNSGLIHWIRQLCTSFQYRYMYLERIQEIKDTRTLCHARSCFRNFIKFYNFYQLTVYIDWINIEKHNIENQLSRRVFKLKNITSPFINDDYSDLEIKPYRIKVLPAENIHQQHGEKNKLKAVRKTPFKKKEWVNNKKRMTNLNNAVTNKCFDKHKISSNQTNKSAENTNKEIVSHQFEKEIHNFRRLILYFFHEEKQSIRELINMFYYNCYTSENKNITKINNCSLPEFNISITDIDVKDPGKMNESIFSSMSRNSETLVCLFSSINNIQTPNEIFSVLISSNLTKWRTYDEIVKDIITVCRNIISICSKNEGNKLEMMCSDSVAAPFLLPLYICDTASVLHLPAYSITSGYNYYILPETGFVNSINLIDYPVLNQISLFEATIIHHLSFHGSHKENQSLYGLLLRSSKGFQSIAFNELTGTWDKNKSSLIQSTSNKFKDMLKKRSDLVQNLNTTENLITSTTLRKNSDIPWHDYIARNLLIEKGHLLDINFDIKLFDVIMELYQMMKLGYQLPGELNGLGLLNISLRNDLKNLKKILYKYNNLILSLTKEMLLSLKPCLFEFEYLLLKGLSYYSWHTTKVEHFYIALQWKIKGIISLNDDIQNLIISIEKNIEKIKSIDWFDFNGPTMTSFKGIKEFFDELEIRRDITFQELFIHFSSIPPLLKKLEFLVFNEYSGRNRFLVLFYKYYEECLLKAIVLNFLSNIKKFRKFIIGAECIKVKLRLIHSYDFTFDFNSRQCTFFFINSIDKLLMRYKMLPRWRKGTCQSTPWIKSSGFNKIYQYNYLEDLIKLKVVALELIDTQNMIHTVTHNLSSFFERWHHYRVLLNFDKEVTTNSFFKEVPSIIYDCDTIFCFYDQFICELDCSKDFADIFCIRIDLTMARKKILNHAVFWKNNLKCKLTDIARTHSSKLHTAISDIHTVLRKEVYSLEDFQNVLQAMKDFEVFCSDCEASLSFITKIQYIIARHGLRYSEDDRKIIRRIQDLYSETQILAKYRDFLIKPSFSIYKNISRDLIITFEKECVLFAEHYYKEGPGTVGKNLDLGCTLLQKFKEGFKKFNARRRQMIHAEVLFEHMPHSYDFFDEAYHEFNHLEIVYELYVRQKESQEQWAHIPWIYLNDLELINGINGFLAEFDELDNKIQVKPVAQEVKNCMINFRDSIPIMVELKNESLKERHWMELMEKTGYHFDMVASKFILNDLFSMKLYEHKATVDDIIGKAIRELKIEKSVENMIQFWRLQQLKFTTENQCLILENNDTMLVLLDDYGIDLGRVIESQFALPFICDLKEWEKKLSQVRQVVFEWTLLQKGFLNLRIIFKDRNLQKAFPKAYEIYQVIDNNFSELVKATQYKSNVLEQTLVIPELLDKILISQSYVEECESLLSKQFDIKRNNFPRFYLLQDKEIINIMGSSFPENIDLITAKVFCNIKAMIFKDNFSAERAIEIRGMMSTEKELFIFQHSVTITENISECMKCIQAEMIYSKKYITKMTIYNYATVIEPRFKWIQNHLNSSILASIRVWWTAEAENTFSKIKKGDLQAMKTYLGVLNRQLNDSYSIVKGNLQKLQRMKYINVILLDLYERDVIDKFANNSVMEATDFEWESQIKFYWKKSIDSLVIHQCLGVWEYSYEYMGVGNQLVVTPLTERIYLSLTQALFHKFVSAVNGPSSTGKTETVKSLASIFGVFCVFINCSKSTSIESFKNLIYALCQDGIWACFDEFNLIAASSLSVIGKYIKIVRDVAVKNLNTLHLNGKEVLIKGNMGLFVTMNPGFFSSNLYLPHTVKLLFRPVSCMLPNIEIISYAILFSEGFAHAQTLSKKIVKLYELASIQLSKKGRYDFSLRTLKPLLEVAGDLKRSAPDMAENVVLTRAIRDYNCSKFIWNGDDFIFTELRQDLFSAIDCPPIVNSELEKSVQNVWIQMGYIYVEKLALKVVQLHDVLLRRPSGVVVGPSGGGKSLVINTLSQALTSINKPTTLIKLNPKAFPVNELFGFFNSNKFWVEGLFTKILREISNSNNDGTKNYILCDGDMDEEWLENISSLLDDNRQLTLANCERIPLLENCGLIFETGHINNVSPGTISRMGIVYVDPENLGFMPFWKKWITSRIDEEEMNLLNILFEKYIPPTLELILEGRLVDSVYYPPLKTVIPQTKLNLVVQLCFMIDAMNPIVEKEIEVAHEKTNLKDMQKNVIKDQCYVLESIFIQAVYASLGSSLSQESIFVFDSFIKSLSKFEKFTDNNGNYAAFGLLPSSEETLFDYCADKNKKCWVPWSALVKSYTHNSETFDNIIVPTKASCKILWLVNLVNEHNCSDVKFKSYKYKIEAKKKTMRPLLIIGSKCSTKTTLLREFSSSLNNKFFSHLNITLSLKTSSSELKEKLLAALQYYTPFTMIPKSGKKLIIFIDDLHRPQGDYFGVKETTEFFRFLLENHGIFLKGNNANWKTIKDVNYFGTMTIKGSSTEPINPRFLSLFSIFTVGSPSEFTIHQIYSSILSGHTHNFIENIKNMCDDIIKATIKIYMFIKATLLPIPSKFHYAFNMRDLSKTIEGLTQISSPFCQTVQQFIRVWRNELTRVFCDRLVSTEDKHLLENEIRNTVTFLFPSYKNYVLRDPLLFGDYRNAMQKGFPRDYEDLLDYEAVYHLFTEIVEDIKKTCPTMNLVLFEDILDHLTRVHRVLRMWRGHALVVGPVGSGKRSIVKLASYTASCKIFQIIVTKNYKTSNFISDMKKLFREVCLFNQQTSFVLTDQQILSEDFLEVLNTILMTGSFKSVLTEEEIDAVVNDHFFDFYDDLKDDSHLFWDELDKNCCKNFHLALLMLELNQVQCQHFPALLDYTTIDWIQSWPSQALSAVARRHLKDAEKIPDRFKEPIVRVIVEIYESTIDFSTKECAYPSYLTPRHFLHLIYLYIKMINQQNDSHRIECQNLDKVIKHLSLSSANVEKLKESIETQKNFVKEKQSICKLVAKNISDTNERLNAEKSCHLKKFQDIETLNQEINQQMSEIQVVLSRAMGDIEKSQESIRDLDMEDITNLSLSEIPSEMTSIVFESVLVLLGETLIDWEKVRKMMCDPLFLNNLEEINLNTITLQQQKQVRARLKRIEKLKDPKTELADKAFLSLIEAILSYCAAFRETKPKQEKISDLEKELNKEQNEINAISGKMVEIENNLEELNMKQLMATSDSEKAEQDLNLTLKKLDAANKLISGLEVDNKRWQIKLGELQKNKPKIIGNCLACCSFLSYCGTFTWKERKQLLSIWIQNIKQNRIPITMPFQLASHLVDDVILYKWNRECLPNSDWSIQNALLTELSEKYPLCIDPKEQGIKLCCENRIFKLNGSFYRQLFGLPIDRLLSVNFALNWIMSKEKENNILVLTFEDPNFFDNFKRNIQTGCPILIKDIDYVNPLVLETLFTEVEEIKSTCLVAEGSQTKVILYMTTKEEKPSFDPYIYSQACVINFSMTEEELEEHLLNTLVQNEQSNLWSKLEETREKMYVEQNKKYFLHKSLLEKVIESVCDILESTEIIEELHGMKLKLQETEENIQEYLRLLSEYGKQINYYTPLAKCGAILFFILSNQSSLNQFNQISLSLFVKLFLYSVGKNISLIGKDYIHEVVLYLKTFFYNYCCRGVFSSQKLLVAFHMAIEFEKSDGNLTDKEIQFFIFGGKEICETVPPFEWLSRESWSDINKLSREFPEDFSDVIAHMATNRSEWNKWYESKDSNKHPFPLANKLKPFHKLMLARCLCIQCLPTYIEVYISNILRNDYLNHSYDSIQEIFEESSPSIPVLFITMPGFDPMKNILQIANTLQMLNKVDEYAMGEDHWNATNLLKEAILTGRWIVFYNCHLDEGLLKKIIDILHSTKLINEDFRLWLTTEPNFILPKSILQISNKGSIGVAVVIDTPGNFKMKLYQIYKAMDDSLLETCDHPCFKRLVFATSVFHSVLKERQKYGTSGWNLNYEFGQLESHLSLTIIKQYLTNYAKIGLDEVPWKCIKYLIGEIIYGGYVLDEYDQRIITTYLDEYYDDILFTVSNIFTFFGSEKTNIEIYPEKSKEDYVRGIDKIVTINTTNLLGFNPYNEACYHDNVMNHIWSQLAKFQRHNGNESNFDSNAEIENKLQKILDILPEEFSIKKIMDNHLEKKYTKPIIFVLCHELELFNSLIKKMHTSLLDLRKALNGEIEMEDWMKEMCGELLCDYLPSSWRPHCPQTTLNLSKWVKHFMKRIDQYVEWSHLGQVPVIWLGGLHVPKSYLISYLQVAAKKNGWAIENLIFKTCITTSFYSDQLNEFNDIGCYISGMHLEGAKWDTVKKCLIPLNSKDLTNPLPILCILPAEKFQLMLKEKFKIPVYETPLKNSTLRGGVVFEAEMSSSVNISKWILQGLCMLLNSS